MAILRKPIDSLGVEFIVIRLSPQGGLGDPVEFCELDRRPKLDIVENGRKLGFNRRIPGFLYILAQFEQTFPGHRSVQQTEPNFVEMVE